MADERKETIILDFEVDVEQALSDIEASEKALLDLRKQQAELNKAYKEGKKSESEYLKEKIKLDREVKTETQNNRTLNQVLGTVSNSLNAQRAELNRLKKTRDDIDQSTAAGVQRFKEYNRQILELNESIKKAEQGGGDFRRSVGDYIKQVNIAGVSVGDLAGKFTSFLNPGTAALGVLAGLSALYATSSAGAKDLSFAHDRLAFFTDTLSESLGKLVSGTGEGGEGVLNKAIDGVIDFTKVIPEFALAQLLFASVTGKTVDQINEESKALARAREELRKLEIEGARAQGFAKLFEKAAEDSRRIRDNEEEILEIRLQASAGVEQNLLANQTVRLNVLNKEIEAIKKANVNWQNQDKIVLQIEQKRAEVRDIEEEINGKLTENFNARKNILTQINDLERATRRAANQLDTTTDDPLIGAFQRRIDLLPEFEARLNRELKQRRDKADEDERARQKKNLEYTQEVENAKLQIISNAFGSASALFEQDSATHKALASAQAIINTYLAATAALASGSKINPVFGIIAAATAVANGLAAVAQINGVQFAEGGYTGPGAKHEPAGIVHAGEVVWSQADVAKVGGPHIANAMRPTYKPYADGGLVANSITQPIDQQFQLANIIKNLPPSEISVKEVTKVQRRVKVKETISQR